MKSHILKKLSSLVLSAALVLGLAACGSGSGEEQDGGSGDNSDNPANANNTATGWVYIPEFMNLDDSIQLYNAQIAGNDMYYTISQYDEEAERWKAGLNRLSLLDGQVTEISLDVPENASLNYWTIGEDGSIYAILDEYEWDEVQNEGHSNYWVAKYDNSGTQVFVNDITSLVQEQGQETYIQNICVDGQGRFYLEGQSYSMDSMSGVNEIMWLLDQEGNYQGTVPFSDWINSVFLGGNGNVYVSYYDGTRGGYVMAEVNFEQKQLGTVYAGLTGYGNGAMFPLSETTYLTWDSNKVYEYDMELQSAEELFTWLDSDINGEGVNAMSVLSDGRIVAVYRDWTLDDSGIALLTKTAAAEAPQKQQIVLAVFGSSYELQPMAVQFNKSSDLYHITIKDYIDSNNWTETAYADAMTNLNNDITSGNCPDIISLYGVNVDQLAAKGVFEDLTPYLDQSTVLDRSDMIENVLNTYTYDGTLVGIPRTFQLETIVGAASMVGSQPGWTLEDIIAFSDAHPGVDLFDRFSKSRILQYCLIYNMDRYVDWNEGTCSFDSEEFRTLLEFANRFPEEPDYSSGASGPGRISRGEVLLADADFYDFDEIQLYEDMFGGEVTCIGFPNSDGDSGCMLAANGALGITTKSSVKDGAWAFIESYLGQERSWRDWGFPNSRSEMEAMIVEATEPKYILDENGDPWLDENGEPMLSLGTSSVGYGDDYSYTYRLATREEAQQIFDLIDVAKPVTVYNDQIYMIISEDVEPFFQGQKSVDQVVDAIQSRVGIYVSENS